MKKILIIGVGFLGRHIADYAESNNKGEVIRADWHKGNNNQIFQVDITSREDVFSLLNKVRPEIIINSSGVLRSANLDMFYNINCLGSVNIYESVLRIDNWNPKIFVIGSAAEYGWVTKDELPIKEDFPVFPLGHYGISKAAQTFNALGYCRQGLNVYVGRIFNLIGAGLSDLLAPSAFARQVVEIGYGMREKKITTGNISGRRDFVDVSDAVKAIFRILERGRKGEIYNICSGRSYSLKDIINIFKEISKIEFTIEIDSNKFKKVDIPDIYGDYSKLNKDTKWVPEISIEKSLKDLMGSWRQKISTDIDLS